MSSPSPSEPLTVVTLHSILAYSGQRGLSPLHHDTVLCIYTYHPSPRPAPRLHSRYKNPQIPRNVRSRRSEQDSRRRRNKRRPLPTLRRAHARGSISCRRTRRLARRAHETRIPRHGVYFVSGILHPRIVDEYRGRDNVHARRARGCCFQGGLQKGKGLGVFFYHGEEWAGTAVECRGYC